MFRKAPFVHKLIGRLEKVSVKDLQKHLSDLAEENQTLQRILHSLEEGILILNREGGILLGNQNAKNWILRRPQVQKEKTTLEDILDPQLKYWLTLQLPQVSEEIEEDLRILEPEERNLKVRLAPLPDTKEILVVLIPQTPNTEFQCDKIYDHMASLVKLSAGIAHEIGNPLNAIGIHLELLKKNLSGLPEKQKKTLEKNITVLKAETQRLDQIVKNFLKATRKPPLRFREENLNTLAAEALAFLKPELQSQNMEVILTPDESLPPCLVDRERLYQVFINLIKNAMDACHPKKGGRLEIRITRRHKIVMLHFKDTGTGIDKEDLPHIFEAYFTTKQEGAGLGLMTVYNIVREHGGRIEVQSEPGRGTEFIVALPIRRPKLQLPNLSLKKDGV